MKLRHRESDRVIRANLLPVIGSDSLSEVRLVVFGDVAVTEDISDPLDIAFFLGIEHPSTQEWYRAEADE